MHKRHLWDVLCVFYLAVNILCRVSNSSFERFFKNYFNRFVVLRVILYSHPNKIFAVVNGIIFQVGFLESSNFSLIKIFQSLAFLALSSHLRTMLTDPGAVPRGNATKENIQLMGFEEGQVNGKHK